MDWFFTPKHHHPSIYLVVTKHLLSHITATWLKTDTHCLGADIFYSHVADSIFHLHRRSLLNFAYIDPLEDKANVLQGTFAHNICCTFLSHAQLQFIPSTEISVGTFLKQCNFTHFLHSYWKALETLHKSSMYNKEKSLNVSSNGGMIVQLTGFTCS